MICEKTVRSILLKFGTDDPWANTKYVFFFKCLDFPLEKKIARNRNSYLNNTYKSKYCATANSIKKFATSTKIEEYSAAAN